MQIDIENKEFNYAFELIQKTNQSFFLTGRAGTGKSTFLKHIVKNVSKKCVVVAPTGIASLNVGGSTIHSFFEFPLRMILSNDKNVKLFSKYSEKRKIISEMDTLIIDEISMVRADLIDGIDYSLRINTGNHYLPFGGKQVVFVGDIFQLEPVINRSSGEHKILKKIYSSPYFFNAKVFSKIRLFTIELKKVYRQTENNFISLLDKIRLKDLTIEEISMLNTRVFSDIELKKKDYSITLTTKNDIANRANLTKIAELKTQQYTYEAEISGTFDEKNYPTDEKLILKIGAQIIFIRNDKDKRWVNGTIGKVSDLNNNNIKIELKDGTVHSIEKVVWENIIYKYNKKDKNIEQEVIGIFKQFPIKLAWAISIHKSQGLTFDSIIIDFGSGSFASGQAYVAFSRVKSFEGLFLKRKISITDFFVDNEILNYSKSYNDNVLIKSKLDEGKEIYDYSKKENWQEIGIYYFKIAFLYLKNNNIPKAYENIMNGYNYITNDNIIHFLYKDSIKDVLINKVNNFNDDFELFFIESFVFYHRYEFKKAIKSINNYIKLKPNDEIGYYYKAIILISIEEFNDALEYFKKAQKIEDTSRTCFRIGILKERHLKIFGLCEILKSIIMNPSCSSAHNLFYFHALKRKIIPQEIKNNYTFFHSNDAVFSARIGLSIEKNYVNDGKRAINEHMKILLEIIRSHNDFKDCYSDINELLG